MKLYEIKIDGSALPQEQENKAIIETEKKLRERFGRRIYKRSNGEDVPIGIVRLPQKVSHVDLSSLFGLTLPATLTELRMR